jgi:hypothetical protein
MRTVMACFALMAGSGFAQNAPAQDAPEKAVRTIRDVQIGMSRDHVLAGLGDQYKCTRIDTGRIEGDQYWMVWPKDDPKSQPERESGAIRFWEGKASSIEIDLYPSMTGEAARFAERLFWLLYKRADPPASPNKLCGVELRIGMSKDEVISRLGKNCKVHPMGTSITTWCVYAPYPCSHLISFEGETLSGVKLDKFYSDLNPRYATLPVELRDMRDDKGEDLRILFTLDGQDFSIRIRKRPGQPDRVDVEQQIIGTATNRE